MIGDIIEWDAAYVLGALSPEDRATFEAYLAAEPDVAASLDELAAFVEGLVVLTPEEALALI